VERWVADDRLDRARPGIDRDGGRTGGGGAVEACLPHPVDQRVLRGPLKARVDRELQRRRLLLGRHTERAGDAAERVDRDLGLHEPRVQQRVVRRLDAALTDDLAGFRILVRVGLELALADLAEEAEELAAEGALRIAA